MTRNLLVVFGLFALAYLVRMKLLADLPDPLDPAAAATLERILKSAGVDLQERAGVVVRRYYVDHWIYLVVFLVVLFFLFGSLYQKR